jgi:hypothetical protein
MGQYPRVAEMHLSDPLVAIIGDICFFEVVLLFVECFSLICSGLSFI